MTRLLASVLLAGAAAGCASAPGAAERSAIIKRIVPAVVQLRAEREGGGRRAGSGVVVAADGGGAGRAWILTTRHLVEPPVAQTLTVRRAGRRERVEAHIVLASPEADLVLVEIAGHDLSPVELRPASALGDEVWVVAFPWGRQLTVVSGVVSQILGPEGTLALEGPPRIVDAPTSYGASGGGVFDAATGQLIGVVEGYRTARISRPDTPGRPLEIPVAGETTVIPAEVIRRFLEASGLEPFRRP